MGYGRVNAFKAVQYAFSLQTTSFSDFSGTDIETTDDFSWVLASEGFSQLAGASYIVKRHDIRLGLSYPFTQAPIIIGTVNGLSDANPNNGLYHFNILDISSFSANVQTWVYEVISTISGQTVSWVPTAPENIRFNLNVLSSLSTDLYFQNQTVIGTETHNAMNKIEAGKNVSSEVLIGDYDVLTGADVTFHAGSEIILSDGFFAEFGSEFHAFIDPFFTCTQYPMGRLVNSDSSFNTTIKDYEVELIEKTPLTSSTKSNSTEAFFSVYPNPSNGNIFIEYNLNKSEVVEITLYDNCGRPVYRLKNKSTHETGTYLIKLTGFDLPSGIYHCILQTNETLKSKEIIIVK
jgi:hypothetical protein